MLKAAYSFISFYHELLNATKLSVFFHIALPFVALKGHLCYLFYLAAFVANRQAAKGQLPWMCQQLLQRGPLGNRKRVLDIPPVLPHCGFSAAALWRGKRSFYLQL